MSAEQGSDNSRDVEREKTIKTLSNTFTNLFENDDLKELNGKLREFTERQDRLSKEIQSEKAFFAEDQNLKTTEQLMTSIQVYKDKLMAIKKTMASIQIRTKNLKRKATDIQEFKLKQQKQP